MSNSCAGVINKNRLDVDRLKYPFGCNNFIDWRGTYVFVGTISFTINGVYQHFEFTEDTLRLATITQPDENQNNFYQFQFVESSVQVPLLKIDIKGIDIPYTTKSKGHGLIVENELIITETQRMNFEVESVNKKTAQANRITLQGTLQLDFVNEDVVDSLIVGELYRIEV